VAVLGIRDNAQLEVQLIAEWWATLPRSWPNKTNVNVGGITLSYNGQVLSPARQRAFGAWNDRADMRIFTGSEVWLVEGKLVNVGGGYGQVLDYCDEYPYSADYQPFYGMPIIRLWFALSGGIVQLSSSSVSGEDDPFYSELGGRLPCK